MPNCESVLPPTAMRITLFFTRKASLRSWVEQGMFDREIAIYQRLQQRGIEVGFVTYGDRSELEYAPRIPGIKILCNRWNLPLQWYERLLHLLHASWLRASDVCKTNQIAGSDIALRSAQFWQKPLIARCGYMRSHSIAFYSGADSAETQAAEALEAKVFGAARKVVVTTPLLAADVKQRIPQAAAHTTVIPNYVDTDHFCPEAQAQPEFDLVYVGRLVPKKNVAALIEAIAPLNLRLLIIGDGEEGESLKSRFRELGDRLHWQGIVPNQQLPKNLNSARAFILPSLFEGHPKVLIEAMSCGLPVIGSDVEGIRELLIHGENGLICSTDVEGIRHAVQTLFEDSELRRSLGVKARAYVLDNFSLNQIVNLEVEVLRELTTSNQSWQKAA